jgi:hypothetical protein
MKNMFRNISLVMMTILVVFLSMGVYISKMQCDKAGRVYIGTETMSCSTDKDIICDSNQEKIACCILEIQKSCCPEQTDNNCSSDIELVQFDFETIVESIEHKTSLLNAFYINSYVSNYFTNNYIVNNYKSDIPPQKLNKPLLAQLQTFLL